MEIVQRLSPKNLDKHLARLEKSKKLENECIERFGEISESDKFEGLDSIHKKVNPFFWKLCVYNHIYDEFYYSGACVYQKGKWAVKIP